MNIREIYLSTYIDDYGRNILEQGCSIKNFNLLFNEFGSDIPDDWIEALTKINKKE